MAGKATLTFADYDGEKSSVSFSTATVGAGNIVAVGAAIDQFLTDIGNVTLGVNVKDVRVYSDTGSGSGQAASPNAQREMKWLCSYTDDITGAAQRMEIPCPLLSANTLGAGGLWNSADALWVAFKSAFENVVVSSAGNAVTLAEVRLVGRNI